MLRKRLNSLILLLLLFSLLTCIDPYTPRLSSYESVLVVDGMMTDENTPCEIKLSRSVLSKDSIPEKVSDAVVIITDELGNSTTLINSGGGSYKTNPADFTGETGKTYTLHISTSDGNEYISDPCTMLPVPDIDNIYFLRDQEFGNNQSEILEGIRFYIDGNDIEDGTAYLRWDVDETWEFRLPSPQRYNYFKEDSILPVSQVKEVCWRSYNSEDIFIHSFMPGESRIINKEPLIFRATDKSDRFLIRYSILVRQLSISESEYNFWDNLKKVNESGGDIFDSQPFAVEGNMTCLNDKSKKVLGYFKVSAVKQKRIFIDPGELFSLDLPQFTYDCKEIVMAPSDYPPANPFAPKMTFDKLYEMYAADPRYAFVEPLYDENNQLIKLVFATVACSDCEIAGTAAKPDFWTESK
jgi:hypothetical protein